MFNRLSLIRIDFARACGWTIFETRGAKSVGTLKTVNDQLLETCATDGAVHLKNRINFENML